MGKQAKAFLDKLGDEWLRANRTDLGKNDLVTELLESKGFFADRKKINVLELGCANGWRLKKYHDHGWNVYGIDPSQEAVDEANKLLGDTRVYTGTADSIPFAKNSFHMVILGHCLCLVDPEDWPQVVAAIDRVLRTPGYIVLHDCIGHNGILECHEVQIPGRGPFNIYTTDFLSLWGGFLNYKAIASTFVSDRRVAATLIKKGRIEVCTVSCHDGVVNV